MSLNYENYYNALHWARDGNIEKLKTIVKVGEFSVEACTKILETAVLNRHTSCVEYLIPFSDPKLNDSRALIHAVNTCNLPCVRLLLPHSDPMAGNSYALQVASERSWIEGFDLLYDVSDPKAAHQSMLTSRFNYADHWQLLEERLAHDALLKGLTDATEHVHAASPQRKI